MPPINAVAIGPKKLLRSSGISASTAAAAVSVIGRKRRTVAPMMASKRLCPARMSCSIWSTRITELRMMMPNIAMVPSIATKPNGMRNSSNASTTPISPSGAVSTTISTRLKLCSCTISNTSTAITSSGICALIEACALAFSSTAPPISIAVADRAAACAAPPALCRSGS